MGTSNLANAESLISTSQSLASTYTVQTGDVSVGGSDSVLLLVTFTNHASLGTLSIKPVLESSFDVLKSDSGTLSTEELSYATTSSAATSIAVRFDTTAVNKIKFQFKGDTANGTIDTVQVLRDGSAQNSTPRMFS